MNQKNLVPEAEHLIEISWEICNKVGGIYSVISTKAKKTKEIYKEYTCIGPYIEEQAKQEFQEKEPPKEYQEAFNTIKNKGINARYGTWLIKGQPNTILLEFSGTINKINELKQWLWEKHEIDSYKSRWDFEEPMLFSYAAAELIHELEQRKKQKTALQTHEWMTGFTILFLKNKQTKIGTTFTTHATMLGRSIAGNNQDLYGTLGKFNPEEKAKELNVEDKHTTEKACAHTAETFTTVSQITSREAEYILSKKPHVLTLNGLDTDLFPSMEEASIRHRKEKKDIQEFLEYMFFPYYSFDTNNNLTFYLASRYEFENKGMDIFIKALSKLNQHLKEKNNKITITALFLIAMPNQGVKKELLEQKNYYRHIKKYIHQNNKSLPQKIIQHFTNGEKTQPCELFTEEFIEELKKEIKRFKKQGNPEICTHNIQNEEQDPIINLAKQEGLNNNKENPVKIILYPAYLNGADGLFNKEFYELIPGTHLGVFPSYYEPWGYTPLESAALGVPAITTDLAGFGRYIQEQEQEEQKGIYIIKRDYKNKEKAIQELYEVFKEYTEYTHSERVEHKIQAKKLANTADWKDLIKNYVEAHNHSLKKILI
ncbi:glycogen/starch synthase [Candidatus Woesearchaeota archaeon]|nr:glycogen/starch synthase [Candidatus Woesearchaeota archaeon]